MSERTEVDIGVICAFCGRPKVVCRCGCTADPWLEIKYSEEEKWI